MSSRLETPNDIEQAAELIIAAEQNGYDAIDTAPVYGDAEQAIGISKTSLEVHTKLDPNIGVRKSLEDSLKRLGRDQLDIVYIHNPATLLTPSDLTLSSLVQYRGSLVKKIGVSVYSQVEYQKAYADPRIDVIQVPHNVLDRRFSDPDGETDRSAPPEVVARSIFLQGLLLLNSETLPANLQGLTPFIRRIHSIAKRFGISTLETLIGFARFHQNFSGVIIGIDSVTDLRQIETIFRNVSLDEDLIAQLVDSPQPDVNLIDPRNW